MIEDVDTQPATAAHAGWTPPQLAVIVPSYNERDNIVSLYDKVATALKGIAFEFIVVDDNSTDATPARLTACL